MKKLLVALMCLLIGGCSTVAGSKKASIRYNTPVITDFLTDQPTVPGVIKVEAEPTSGTRLTLTPVAGQQFDIPKGWTGKIRIIYQPAVWDGTIGSETCPVISDPCMSCWIQLSIKRDAVKNPLTGAVMPLVIYYQNPSMTSPTIVPQSDAIWWFAYIEKGTSGQKIIVEATIAATDWR